MDPSKHRRRGAETKRPLPQARADALAANLDVDLDCGICHACLSFVSFAIDRGDPDEIARETRRITPDLWYEGLAEELSRRARTEVRLEALARDRLRLAPPELN